MNMKIVLDEQFTERSVRADLAWELFFRSKTEMPKGHSEPLLPFANWFWDEMGQRAGRLMKNSKGEATVTIPPLAPEALDFLVRLHRSGLTRSTLGGEGLCRGTCGRGQW